MKPRGSPPFPRSRETKPASPAQLRALAARAPLANPPNVTGVALDFGRSRAPADSIVGTDAWREQRAATVARERRAIAAKLDMLESLAAELGYTVIRGRKA